VKEVTDEPDSAAAARFVWGRPDIATPNEASGIINDAIGNGVITGGGPGRFPPTAALTARATPTGGISLSAPPTGLLAGLPDAPTTEDGIATPITYLRLLQQATDIANRIVAGCDAGPYSIQVTAEGLRAGPDGDTTVCATLPAGDLVVPADWFRTAATSFGRENLGVRTGAGAQETAPGPRRV
jgi:hypothetical protein